MLSDEPKKPLINILAFHKIQKNISYSPNNFSPKRFGKLMEFLSAKGYKFVSVADILTSPADNKIAFTFDDGYAHLFDVLPMFIETFKFTPTIYMPTFYIGKKNKWDYNYFLQKTKHLDRKQINKLSDIGIKFGTHGHTHTSLLKLSLSKVKEELLNSKDQLEEITGQPTDSMSYPFGRFSNEIVNLVGESGYQIALTMNFPDSADTNYNLGRYAVYGYDTNRTILSKIKRGRLFFVEKAKAKLTNKLSGGTIILNSFRKK